MLPRKYGGESMQGKKKYFALILFLLIGLMVFTFANPKEDEEKEDEKANIGEVVKDEVGKTTTTNRNLTEDQNVVVFNAVNTGRNVQTALTRNTDVASLNQIEDDSYAKALEAVKKAEESLIMGDYDSALNLVNNLTDGNDKDALQDRLDEVLNAINVSELVVNLEKMVKEATSLTDMTDARGYNTKNDISNVVSKLENEKLKEELSNRLNDLNGLLSDEDSPVITGISDGDVVNTLANVKVEDANTYTVTLNGEAYDLGTELAKDGEYELVVVDAAFNETKIKFTYDTTAPVLSVKSDSVGTDDVYSKVNFKLSDNVGLAKVIINDKEYKRTGKWNDLNFQNVNNYVEGENKVVLIDKAGNETKFKFVLDTTAPIITLYEKGIKVEAGKYYTSTLKATIEDKNEYKAILKDHSGNEVDYISGSNITKRANYTLVVIDKAGNKSEITFAIDKDYPLVYLNGSKNEKVNKNVKYYNKDVEIKISDLNLDKVVFTKDGKEIQFNNNSVITEEGNYVLLAIDKANHKTQVNFIIDKTMPVISVKSDFVGIDGVYSKVNFKLSDNVGLSKAIVNGKEYKRTGKWGDLNFQNVSNYVEGENKVVLVDVAGNETELKFILDTTAPIYDSLRIVGGTHSSSDNTYYAKDTDKVYVYVAFNEKLATVPTLKISGKEYAMKNVYNAPNGKYQYYSDQVIAKNIEEGVVNFEIYNYADKVGNIGVKLNNSNITLLSQSKVIVDRTAPKLKLNGESNITLKLGIDNYDELGALAVDEVDGVINLLPKQISYYTNGVLNGMVSNVDMNKPGTYKIIYKYTDKAGNIGVDESRSDYDYVMRVVTVEKEELPIITDVTGNVDLDEQNSGFYKNVFFAKIDNSNNFAVLEKGFIITDLEEIANSADFIYENSSEILNENRIIKSKISGTSLSYRLTFRKIKPNSVRYAKPYAIIKNSKGISSVIYGDMVKTVTPSM